MKRIISILLVLAVFTGIIVISGCTTTQKGALVGGAVGAGSGAIIGHQAGDSGRGALIGAGIGALTGALVGDFVDNYEVDVRRRDRYQAPPEYYDDRAFDRNDW